MDFTEIYKQTHSLAAFSQGAQFILTAVHDRLIVRRSDTFQITRTWLVDNTPSATSSILNPPSSKAKAKSQAVSVSGLPQPPPDGWISHIGWSKDSEYILAACAKRGVVNIFRMREEEWNARIEVGAEGLVKAEWAPDGRSVVCFSEWGLRVTVWSLVTGTATYIQYPKHPDRGYAFRKDGRYFVLAERHRSKDTIGVYDTTESYKLVRHFTVPTSSLSSIALSPSGVYVAVWDGPLEYKLYIYSVAGQQLGSFVPTDPGPALGLGIRAAAWHPTSSFIAVGGWDDKIHIISNFGWVEVATFDLASRIPSTTVIWREPPGWYEATAGRGFLAYERSSQFQSLSAPRPDPSKAPPKSGVVQLEWNTTGSLLLVRFEQIPTVVHIFSFPTPSATFTPQLRTVLLHSQPVLSARWNPVKADSLVLCCGNGALYTWEEHGAGPEGEGQETAECIGIPAKQFDTRDMKWSPDGTGLILFDKDAFCCAFQVSADDLEEHETEEIQGGDDSDNMA